MKINILKLNNLNSYGQLAYNHIKKKGGIMRIKFPLWVKSLFSKVTLRLLDFTLNNYKEIF